MNKTTLESLEEALERLEQIDGKYSWAHLLYEVREALAEQAQLQQAKEMLLAVDDVVKQSLSLAVQDDFAASGKLMDHIADPGKVIAEPVKQEPVGVVESSEEWGMAGVLIAGLPIGTKLYAAPVSAKREWVDLTDDEILKAIRGIDGGFEGFRALITAFKEKNR